MKFLIFVLCVFSAVTQAKQTVWLSLTPDFIYKDLQVVCSNINDLSVHLGVEVENGVVTRAVFDGDPESYLGEVFFFQKEELSLIEVKQSENGVYLSELHPNARILNHVLSRVNTLELQCAKPQLESIQDAKKVLFERFPIGKAQALYKAPTVKIWGYRKDGWAWNLEINFTQKPYKSRVIN